VRPVAALKRQELRWLAGAIVLGLVVRVAYVLLIRNDPIVNDEVYYDTVGKLAQDGKWLWGTAPYGVPHPTFWKTPGYPLFVGAVYTVLGAGPTKLELVQALLSPATIVLTWLLARRLFADPRVAIASALVVAVYPFAWLWTVLMFPEAIAIPAVLAMLVVGLEREPTLKRAALLGLLAGVTLMIRSNSFVFVIGVLAGWLVAIGPRRALPLAAVTAGIAALCLVPWTIRNYDLSDKIVPLSVQDGAISGVFNDDAAHDEQYPWAWRPVPKRDVDIWTQPRSDGALLTDLRSRAFDYIADHPESVPKSIFWNGVTRLWDLRRPSHVVEEIDFEGGRRSVKGAGLAMYWLMLPFALLGLWRLRRRRELFTALVTIIVVSTVLGAAASGSRYRATFEPVIVILAMSVIVEALARRRPASTP
jgi:4-amino-4-deoxy-L-arabinose transferase-like glycosyltransferase